MAIEFLSLDLGCGDFILTNSIAFFYSFGLTSIVYLHCRFLRKKCLHFLREAFIIILHILPLCRCDGIGRRSGLKIRFVSAGLWARKPLIFLDFFAFHFFEISDGPPEWASDFQRLFSGIFIENIMCRYDGIGRRSGLKIHRWRHRAGSTPATGTIHSKPANACYACVCGFSLFPQSVASTGIRL